MVSGLSAVVNLDVLARVLGIGAAAVAPLMGAVIVLAVVAIALTATAVAERHRDAPAPS